MGDKLLDQIFNLKFTSKQLNKQSQKSSKDEKAERLKVKKAIEKGNLEGAKIYAQNAIRKKNEALNYLRLASRLDAVVSRLDTQAKMQTVNKSMAGIVKALEKSLASNNLEQVLALRSTFVIISIRSPESLTSPLHLFFNVQHIKTTEDQNMRFFKAGHPRDIKHEDLR